MLNKLWLRVVPLGLSAVIEALNYTSEASDRLFSNRLQPFLAEILTVLGVHDEQHGHRSDEILIAIYLT